MPSLWTVLREWGRLGCIGFGGPPTHIALLRQLCVERRGWLDAREFEDAVAAYQNALKAMPDDPAATRGLASAKAATNNPVPPFPATDATKSPWEYTGLVIQAAEDGTTVTVASSR